MRLRHTIAVAALALSLSAPLAAQQQPAGEKPVTIAAMTACALAVRSVQPPPSTLYKVTRLDRRARRVSTSACCAL